MPDLLFDPTEALSFKPIKPGTYEMRIDSIGDLVKGPKANYVEIKFVFTDPDLDRAHGYIPRNYMLNGKGAGFFKALIEKVTGLEIAPNEPINIDTEDLIGQEVTVQVSNEEWESELRNRVDRVI